ncbi:MAG: hypothetical protein M1305_08160, partial [Candidatus Marsarchaeota archaeon]|nr:hypothetical protein [Candidatus Marsarchaeota archaeon]
KAPLLSAAIEYGPMLVAYWYMLGEKDLPRSSDVFYDDRIAFLKDIGELAIKPWNSQELRKRIEARQYTWFRFTTNIAVDKQHDTEALVAFIKQFMNRYESVNEPRGNKGS